MALTNRLVHLRVILNTHRDNRILKFVPDSCCLNVYSDYLKNSNTHEQYYDHQNAENYIRKSLVAEYSFFQYFYHFQNTSLVPSAVAEIVIGVVLKTKKLKS